MDMIAFHPISIASKSLSIVNSKSGNNPIKIKIREKQKFTKKLFSLTMHEQ